MTNDFNTSISEHGAAGALEVTDPQFVINGLAQLLDDTWLVALVPLQADASVGRVPSEWKSSTAPDKVRAEVIKLVTERLTSKGALGYVEDNSSSIVQQPYEFSKTFLTYEN